MAFNFPVQCNRSHRFRNPPGSLWRGFGVELEPGAPFVCQCCRLVLVPFTGIYLSRIREIFFIQIQNS